MFFFSKDYLKQEFAAVCGFPLGAGVTFDLTFFDNSKVIDFDD
jgi:hypothetical protein